MGARRLVEDLVKEKRRDQSQLSKSCDGGSNCAQGEEPNITVVLLLLLLVVVLTMTFFGAVVILKKRQMDQMESRAHQAQSLSPNSIVRQHNNFVESAEVVI